MTGRAIFSLGMAVFIIMWSCLSLPAEKLCLEDFIELQEIIIPSVVGGILGVLLFVIFTSYLIAYVRRKRREGRYESINDAVY